MKQDQNRIELRLNTAEYDECVLYANEETRVLPGSLLVFIDGNVSNSRDPVRPNRGYASFDYEPKLSAKVYSSAGVIDGYMMNPETGVIDRDTNWGPYTRYQFEVEQSESEEDILEAYADAFEENETPSIELLKQKLAVPGSIDRFPCAVVLENALFGRSLSHESPAGELVSCRYLTSSNEVLLRAVPGTYYYGDMVYAVQTKTNGIWVASKDTLSDGVSAGILDTGAVLGMKVGICQEDYRITPAMCFIIDNTEPEDPTGYIPADQDVDSDYARRYGASAIPTKLYGNDGFYQSTTSASRYFAGAMLNLIKVRTTAFYASTTPLPAIEGVEVSPVGGLGYNGTARTDLGGLVTVTGTDPTADILSYSLQGAGEVKNAGSYVVVVRVQRQGYQTLTKRATVNIAKAALSVSGSTVADKEQDDTTTAVVTLGTVYGIKGTDSVIVTPHASFPSTDVGEYTVTISYTMSGAAASNYTAPASTTDIASITEKQTPGPNPTGDEELEGVSIGYSSLGDTITYDGVDRPISDFFEFTGTESGDDINYYVDGTLFGGEVPTVKLPGSYSVRITVDREGYAQFSQTLPVTINKAHVTVTGSTAQDKAYDKSTYATLNLGTVTGLVAGDDATLGYSAAFASSLPGVQDVVVTYSLGGADIGHYILDTVNETLSAEITTKPFSITGTVIKEKVYDGTSAAEVVVGSVTGLIEGDDVTITGSAIFHTVTVGDYNITVHYTLTGADADKYYAAPQTRPTKIKPKRLTITGTTVADKTYDGTTAAVITPGTLSGLVGSDTVDLTATGSFPSAEVGDYEVDVSYSISGGAYRNYYAPVNDTVNASITDAGTSEPVYTYSAVANGGPTETTTQIAVNMIGEDPSAIPTAIPYSNIEIGGDAVLNTNEENCIGSLGIFAIPVRMKKGAKDSYEITIRITAGNQDTEVKPVTAYFMSGYWGCYPCQLNNGATEPTAAQIVNMYDRHVLVGAKANSVSCTFALDVRNWHNEVQANGVTGDDADIEESGCGYEFFITCWDNTTIGTITNEANIPQNTAFKPFVITINGVEYSGVVSKNCDLPSGTSPYTVNLN